jgi:hypothetical protein
VPDFELGFTGYNDLILKSDTEIYNHTIAVEGGEKPGDVDLNP